MFVRLFLAVVLLALPVARTFAGAPTALLLPKDADRLWHTPLGFRYKANVVSQVAFSPDGATLAAVCSDFTNHAIRLFDLVNQREIIRFGGDGRGYYDMLFSPDGTLLYATGSNGDFPREHDIRVWSVATGKQVGRSFGFIDEILSIHLAEQGRKLISTDRVGRLRLWDANSLTEKNSWLAPIDDHTRLMFPADGERVAFVSKAKHVEIWDSRLGLRLRKITDIHTDQIAFSPDGRLLVCADNEAKRVRVFETGSGLIRHDFRGASQSFGVMTVSPDNNLLAINDGDIGVLRDLSLNKEVLRSSRCWLYAAAFSRDGRRFAVSPTGSQRDNVDLWMLPAPAAKVGAQDIQRLWDDLRAVDGAQAHRAIRSLIGTGDPAVAWLGERLKPAPPVGEPELRKLVADLDSHSFRVRDSARDTLEAYGNMAKPVLSEGLKANPTLEARRRLEQLVSKLGGPLGGENLRTWRALEVLERIGTPAARDVLRRMAEGMAQAEITQEAVRALGRLRSE